jgi:hypothetical protein
MIIALTMNTHMIQKWIAIISCSTVLVQRIRHKYRYFLQWLGNDQVTIYCSAQWINNEYTMKLNESAMNLGWTQIEKKWVWEVKCTLKSFCNETWKKNPFVCTYKCSVFFMLFSVLWSILKNITWFSLYLWPFKDQYYLLYFSFLLCYNYNIL